jgi:hypothetical protein
MLQKKTIIKSICLLLLGIVCGYFFRMMHVSSNEVMAFEAGKQSSITIMKRVMKSQQGGGIFHYNGFRFVPRCDGRFIIEIAGRSPQQ